MRRSRTFLTGLVFCFAAVLIAGQLRADTTVAPSNLGGSATMVGLKPTPAAKPSPTPAATLNPDYDPDNQPRPARTGLRPMTATPTATCYPHYRWPIKTLTDSSASLVNLTPQDTTIASLRALPKPSPFPLPSEYPTRLSPVEFTTYRLTNVTLYSIDPSGTDLDYHVILQDSSGHQFIVESTNPTCAAGSVVLSEIQAVRSYFDSHYTIGSSAVYPNVPVTVTGVGFYDPWPGGQHPPSGLELHPLLSIVINGTPLPSPSPSPGYATYYPGTTAAPTSIFYTYPNESGNISQEMDTSVVGSLTNETLTYQASPAKTGWGWVSGSGQPGATAWPAATYTVKLSVTVSNAALQITEVKIIRTDLNGGPSYDGLAVVGTLSGLSQSLGSAGVLTFTIPGAAQVANASDRLAVKVYVVNTASSKQSFSYAAGATTLSQLVVSPVATGTPTPTPTPT